LGNFSGSHWSEASYCDYDFLNARVQNPIWTQHARMAIATRFFLGFLHGSLGTIRAYAVEVCRPEHHAVGLSLVLL